MIGKVRALREWLHASTAEVAGCKAVYVSGVTAKIDELFPDLLSGGKEQEN